MGKFKQLCELLEFPHNLLLQWILMFVFEDFVIDLAIHDFGHSDTGGFVFGGIHFHAGTCTALELFAAPCRHHNKTVFGVHRLFGNGFVVKSSAHNVFSRLKLPASERSDKGF